MACVSAYPEAGLLALPLCLLLGSKLSIISGLAAPVGVSWQTQERFTVRYALLRV